MDSRHKIQASFTCITFLRNTFRYGESLKRRTRKNDFYVSCGGLVEHTELQKMPTEGLRYAESQRTHLWSVCTPFEYSFPFLLLRISFKSEKSPGIAARWADQCV